MSNDRRKDKSHPLGWSSDPVQQGKDERKTFGEDRQSPRQPGESWPDYQRRVAGGY